MISAKEREMYELNCEYTKQIDECIVEVLRNLIDIPVVLCCMTNLIALR